jgi:hypothetical protein
VRMRRGQSALLLPTPITSQMNVDEAKIQSHISLSSSVRVQTSWVRHNTSQHMYRTKIALGSLIGSFSMRAMHNLVVEGVASLLLHRSPYFETKPGSRAPSTKEPVAARSVFLLHALNIRLPRKKIES